MRTCLWVFLLVLAAIYLDECFARHVPHPVAADDSELLVSTAHRLEEEEEHGDPADYQWWTPQAHTPAADWEFLTSNWNERKLRTPFRNGLWRGVSKSDVESLPQAFLTGDGKTPLIHVWDNLPRVDTCEQRKLSKVGFLEYFMKQQGKMNDIEQSDAWVAGNPHSVASVATGRFVSLSTMGLLAAKSIGKDALFEGQHLISLNQAKATLLDVIGGKPEQADYLFGPATIQATTLGPTLNVHTLSGSSIVYGSSDDLAVTRRNYVDMLMLWSPPADPNVWDVARGTGYLVPKYSFFRDVGAAQKDVAFIVQADQLPVKAFRVRVYKAGSRWCR